MSAHLWLSVKKVEGHVGLTEGVDALVDKVELVQVPFAIYELEVKDPLEEELMCTYHLVLRDHMLENDTDNLDQPTEVRVVWLR